MLTVHLLQLLAQLLQLFVGLLLCGRQLLEVHLADRQLLAQLQHRRIFRIGHQQLALIFQTPLALGQAFQALLQLLNARLLHLGGATRLGTALVEAFPLFLPALHGHLGVFQLGAGFLRRCAGQFLLGLEHRQLLAERCQQGAVVAQVGFGFQARLLGVTQVVLQLAQTLLAVLDALLHPGDIAAH